jgi:hypothetical protein
MPNYVYLWTTKLAKPQLSPARLALEFDRGGFGQRTLAQRDGSTASSAP